MARDLLRTLLYHITDIGNIAEIARQGGLFSDGAMRRSGHKPQEIGYSHIKDRRLTSYRVPCVESKFVGEFVPFYYCPRSPMLFTINKGNTGLPAGNQKQILHLVTNVDYALQTKRRWAISDGNAGADHALFSNDLASLDGLDWDLIGSDSWGGKTHRKMAEFLVEDYFPWSHIHHIGCYNAAAVQSVELMLKNFEHRPKVAIHQNWYY